MIWQNSLHVEEHASDLAKLPLPVIWQNCLSVDSVPVIWQKSQHHVEECASDLAELPVPVILAELSVWGECASDLAELPVPVIWLNCLSVESAVPVIWQNCQHVEEERASDLAEVPVAVIWQYVEECARDFAELPAC